MAYLTEIYCHTCNKSKQELRGNSDHWNRECSECRNVKAQNERTQWLKDRAELTVEHRLSLIEQYIYDYKPPVDIRGVLF